jgi:endonuclease YncB( thermonuclease family)
MITINKTCGVNKFEQRYFAGVPERGGVFSWQRAASIILLLLAFPLASLAMPITGTVVGVSDGDTLTLLDASSKQHKIRLSGIDAPESGQAFGSNSKKALSDCAFGKQAVVETDKIDRYGRSIGRVVVAGVDCNLRQAQLGLAWHYVKYASERPAAESRSYAQTEQRARAEKIGLWSDSKALPPWEWRQGARSPIVQAEGCSCATSNLCTGSRGGSYCIGDSGNKKYTK